MTETASQRLRRMTNLLSRVLDDRAHGRVSAADVRRVQEDTDAALRAYEREQSIADNA